MTVAERSAQTPLYEEVVHKRIYGGFMFMFGLIITVGAPFLMITIFRAHPHDALRIILFAVLLLLLLPAPPYAYFCVYPLQITVDKVGVNLRSGKTSAARNKTIALSSVTAIRRSRYNSFDYEKSDRPVVFVGGAQAWKMGGKQVLEIEAQDSRRIIILSSRADQLASLLHEMTRIPVENCR